MAKASTWPLTNDSAGWKPRHSFATLSDLSSSYGLASGGGLPVIVAVRHCSFTTASFATLIGKVTEWAGLLSENFSVPRLNTPLL